MRPSRAAYIRRSPPLTQPSDADHRVLLAVSEIPIGGTTDLLVAMANSGGKSFNMSHIEAKLLGKDGKVFKDLGRCDACAAATPRLSPRAVDQTRDSRHAAT